MFLTRLQQKKNLLTSFLQMCAVTGLIVLLDNQQYLGLFVLCITCLLDWFKLESSACVEHKLNWSKWFSAFSSLFPFKAFSSGLFYLQWSNCIAVHHGAGFWDSTLLNLGSVSLWNFAPTFNESSHKFKKIFLFEWRLALPLTGM